MADFVSIGEASAVAGVNRNTISRWIGRGLLKTKPSIINRRPVVLVSLAAVKKLVGDGIKPGRPKKPKG
jgi:hypothetical protein